MRAHRILLPSTDQFPSRSQPTNRLLQISTLAIPSPYRKIPLIIQTHHGCSAWKESLLLSIDGNRIGVVGPRENRFAGGNLHKQPVNSWNSLYFQSIHPSHLPASTALYRSRVSCCLKAIPPFRLPEDSRGRGFLGRVHGRVAFFGG